MAERKAEYAVLPLIINRWSPRALSGESISETDLMSLFEAARWAPSSFNNQPWRFIYARRETPDWDRMFKLMNPTNQSWAKNAAVLILVISHNYFEYNGKNSRTHSLDTGAATENLALQAFSMGLVCHGMEGFDYDKARKEFNIPDAYTIEALYAIGKRGDVENLDPELQEKEHPSDRKRVVEFVFEGTFKSPKKSS
jgi:nitroreductase